MMAQGAGRRGRALRPATLGMTRDATRPAGGGLGVDWGQAETEPLMEQVQDASQGSGQAACGMSRADGVTSSSAGAHEHGPMAHSFVLGPGRDVRVQGVSALHGCVTPAAPNRLPSPLAPPGPAAWRH